MTRSASGSELCSVMCVPARSGGKRQETVGHREGRLSVCRHRCRPRFSVLEANRSDSCSNHVLAPFARIRLAADVAWHSHRITRLDRHENPAPPSRGNPRLGYRIPTGPTACNPGRRDRQPIQCHSLETHSECLGSPRCCRSFRGDYVDRCDRGLSRASARKPDEETHSSHDQPDEVWLTLLDEGTERTEGRRGRSPA